MVTFGILGPVEVHDAERPLPLGGPRQLALLAVLLLHANRAVSSESLLEAVWGETGHDTAAAPKPFGHPPDDRFDDDRVGDDMFPLIRSRPPFVVFFDPVRFEDDTVAWLHKIWRQRERSERLFD